MNNFSSPLQYRIPATLAGEIAELEIRITDFSAGRISEAQLKAFRVPFGIYEQRVKGLFMARIRCPAGIISLLQLRAAADAALRYGSGRLHITTRQELQIHDVPLRNLVPLLRELAAVNLSSRGGGGNTVRNITASWNAGIAPEEPFDVTPYAVELTSRLVALPDSWLLPRKFKIAFSNGISDSAFATVNDVGFVATLRDGCRGFKVFVAGGMGRNPRAGMILHDFITEDEVFLVAESVKRLFSRFGNRRNKHAARLRFLLSRLGKGPFCELYNNERVALVAERPAPFKPPKIDLPSAPLSGSHSWLAADSDAFVQWRSRYVTVQRQAGRNTVLIPVLLGNVTAAQVTALADEALSLGIENLRLTQNQNISMRDVPDVLLEKLHGTTHRISALSAEPALYCAAVACAGSSTCQLGICRSRDALAAVINRLRNKGVALDGLGSFRLNISGCSNSCGQHPIADLGFAGKVASTVGRRYPAYTVFAGAQFETSGETRLAEKITDVPAARLPDFVAIVLEKYLERRSAYPRFADYLSGEGRDHLRKLGARFANVPTYSDEPGFYCDFGEDHDFNLDGRGSGECASGLFDLVDIDIAKLRSLRLSLASTPTGIERAHFLGDLAYIAARALLVTCGIEASGATVFDEFKKQFIEARLISSQFTDLVDALRKDPQCVHDEPAIIRLADSVEALYNSMDDTMQFHLESTAPASPTLVADAEKDLRGVACPMNFVKTKMALAQLGAGQVLEIRLDNGAPIDNVPKSVEAEGHQILAAERDGDHWRIIIRKA